MLSCDNITVHKGGRDLITAVSVILRPGQLHAIIGPNGAGKSTLVRALMGAEHLASGAVLLDGQPLADWPRRDIARRIAFLPQTQDLHFPFSVREVVLMGRSPHFRLFERPEDLDAADAALEALDLQDFAQRNYMTLSGGEKQRVNLARCLVQNNALRPAAEIEASRFLILDEPNNNLDVRHQLSLLAIARRLTRENGLGVIAILHDIAQAADFADHLVVMSQGQIAAAGDPDTVFQRTLIEEVFGITIRRQPGLSFTLAKS